MEAQDIFITPIYAIVFLLMAFFCRPYVTNNRTRSYYMPAFIARMFGAIFIGLLYQFYYGSGDTLNFFHFGSARIWDAFLDSPGIAFELIFGDRTYDGEKVKYIGRMLFYRDQSSYNVIRIASIFGILSFNTYSSVALFFSLLSFSGAWAMFTALQDSYPRITRYLAIAILFLPSVVIWGSGYLKDTVTISALGWSVYFILKSSKTGIRLIYVIGLFLCLFTIYSIKPYILMCFLPAILIYTFFNRIAEIRSVALKLLVAPIVACMLILFSYASLELIGSDSKYSIENVGKTAMVTAYDIRFYTGKDAGSGYYLGELDGSVMSMIRLFPQAVNVSLFRPYLWEVRNPLMLLAAMESLLVLLITIAGIRNLIRSKSWKQGFTPLAIMLLTFAIIFSFAVGVSTYNFGTLSRYKIPALPFYLSALAIVMDRVKSKYL